MRLCMFGSVSRNIIRYTVRPDVGVLQLRPHIARLKHSTASTTLPSATNSGMLRKAPSQVKANSAQTLSAKKTASRQYVKEQVHPHGQSAHLRKHKRRSHQVGHVHYTVTLKHIAQSARRTNDTRFALYCADKLLSTKTLLESDAIHATHIYKHAKQPCRCAEVLAYMKKSRMNMCAGVYNTVIASYGVTDDCDSAYSYYQEMDVYRVKRDNDTHKVMITAFSRAGRYSEAHMMLRRMHPNIHTYNWVIYAYAKCGKWAEAHSLLSEMRDSGTTRNLTTYNNVIVACVQLGKVNEAVKLLNDMQKVGIKPTTATYSGVISACEVAGRWEEALRLLREMPSKGLQYSTGVFSKTIATCERAMQWDTALELLREMNRRRIAHTTRTYSSLINLVHWTEAVDLFLDMDTKGLKKDVRTYGALIEALAKERNMQADVDRLYDSMVLHIPEAAHLWHVFESEGDLDLHHHSYHMATAAVRRLLRTLLTKEHTWLNRELARINDDGIKGYRIRSRTRSERNSVVVGKGLNSVNGPVLMDLVQTQLGMLDPPVVAYTLPKNKGCLVLDDKTLNAWLWSNM
ncbi:hypothetical protein SARC_03717 [Sphaeroforma arctica JP610]|uniref:Pentacotripeptide-repeat region of PRORP domain-containing protein n=1 Tax=Sphaeroforma arctica JP610 TaxID=667725 RepID=A0A0L0G4T8_9EUKA|nr:hypothetical protein SARC_03717 [Sphaeroforma arctica JP610]KNC84055.1 hypothetical protein SARC_03717 [Sphaeroforma arctica JP610]|eukprot:XP_014157957.1 hypothetical protein SARC_03717 [Sphaeroforma arctica JP610]